MHKRYLTRKEHFGLTVFDRAARTHFFLGTQASSDFLAVNDCESMNNVVLDFRSDILYSPIRVYYETTLACNLTCKTCLNNSGLPLKNELSLDQAKQVIDGLRRDHVFEVKFTGGEPTQKIGWDVLLGYAHKCGLVTSINTNAICDQLQLEKLAYLAPDEIAVSLDGDREANDSIRGNGNYERATQAIRILREHGCHVTINSLVTRLLTEHSINNLLSFANDYCESISFFHPRPFGRAAVIKDAILNYQELNQKMLIIENLRERYNRVRIQTRSANLRRNVLRREQTDPLGLMHGGPDGFTRFNILSNGDIYPGGCIPYSCENASSLKLGNIVTEDYSLLNIWRASTRLEAVRTLSTRLQDQCETCEEYAKICPGFTLEMELYTRSVANGNGYCLRRSK